MYSMAVIRVDSNITNPLFTLGCLLWIQLGVEFTINTPKLTMDFLLWITWENSQCYFPKIPKMEEGLCTLFILKDVPKMDLGFCKSFRVYFHLCISLPFWTLPSTAWIFSFCVDNACHQYPPCLANDLLRRQEVSSCRTPPQGIEYWWSICQTLSHQTTWRQGSVA